MARSSITGGILCLPHVQSRIDMSTKTLEWPLRHVIIMPRITCQVLFTRSKSKRMSTSYHSQFDVKCCFHQRLIYIPKLFKPVAMQRESKLVGWRCTPIHIHVNWHCHTCHLKFLYNCWQFYRVLDFCFLFTNICAHYLDDVHEYCWREGWIKHYEGKGRTLQNDTNHWRHNALQCHYTSIWETWTTKPDSINERIYQSTPPILFLFIFYFFNNTWQ